MRVVLASIIDACIDLTHGLFSDAWHTSFIELQASLCIRDRFFDARNAIFGDL